MRFASLAFAVVVALSGVACASDPVGVADPGLRRAPGDGGITPMCQLGCVDVDPSPGSPGVFVGHELTAHNCVGDVIWDDFDNDGMADYCERRLSEAFAPWMRHHSADEVGGEAVWAAQRWGISGKGTGARISYLMNYYLDLGVVSERQLECEIFTLGTSCEGHSGDAESLALDIYYVPGTEHWVLAHAKLAQHTFWVEIDRGTKAYPAGLAYWKERGGAPVIWVARQKHASYESEIRCNHSDGGPAPDITRFDNCTSNNSYFRPNSAATRNIGSARYPLLDCVGSYNPWYQPPNGPPRANECMWTGARFYGWQLDRTSSSDPNINKLVVMGFANP